MRSHRRSTSLVTLIASLICFALLSSAFAPFTSAQAKSLAGTAQDQSGRKRPQLGPPVGNLPNPDEVRSNDTSKANSGNDHVGLGRTSPPGSGVDLGDSMFVSFKQHCRFGSSSTDASVFYERELINLFEEKRKK